MSAPLLAVGDGWRHLWRGLRVPRQCFLVNRSMSCPAGHADLVRLQFSDWGKVLDNPEVLTCQQCGRELGAL